jgi:ubiquinone/menaquinone biosynthesis C-methylase UbiE
MTTLYEGRLMAWIPRLTRCRAYEFSGRKQQIRDHADRMAAERWRWIEKNAAYYADDRRYMRFLIPEGAKVLDLGCGTGDLLAALRPLRGVGIDLSPRMVEEAQRRHPGLDFRVGDVEDENLLEDLDGPFDFIVISDTIGLFDDCDSVLRSLHRICDENTRIIIVYYSHTWEPLLRLAEIMGQKMPQPEVNFLSTSDIVNLLQLADLEPIKYEWRQLLPKRLLGLGQLANRWIGPLPLIRGLCLRNYIVARSMRKAKRRRCSVSVIVPCRNERGNIEAVVRRMPRLAPNQEIIFVEGHSSDGTLAECERVWSTYADTWDIKVTVQEGAGKGDAVRKGFALARGDVLMILDADLTMPPEMLPRYYDALVSGKGELITGTRLVYPRDKGAMRLLNYWANRLFALFFSFALNQRYTDTLCGTKVLTKENYKKIAANRGYFGSLDPFGDFDLILGASKLNLKTVEIPVRYSARRYGEPQISRFRDGWLLLRMALLAWVKLKAL